MANLSFRPRRFHAGTWSLLMAAVATCVLRRGIYDVLERFMVTFPSSEEKMWLVQLRRVLAKRRVADDFSLVTPSAGRATPRVAPSLNHQEDAYSPSP